MDACVSVEDKVISESECVHVLVCLDACMSLSPSVIKWEMQMIERQKIMLFFFSFFNSKC